MGAILKNMVFYAIHVTLNWRFFKFIFDEFLVGPRTFTKITFLLDFDALSVGKHFLKFLKISSERALKTNSRVILVKVWRTTRIPSNIDLKIVSLTLQEYEKIPFF